MRERERGIGLASERDGIAERECAVRDIDGPAVVEEAVERVLDRCGGAVRDHRAREVGAAQRAAGALGRFDHRLDVDANPALGELRAHHAHAVAARLAQQRELRLDRREAAAARECEQVHRAAVLVARDLDAADAAGDLRARARVVIGQREDVNAAGLRARRNRLGRLGTVGAGRMAVQLEAHRGQGSSL